MGARRLVALVGCALALLLLAGVGLAAGEGETAAGNRALARAQAASLLAMVQLPADATSSPGEPAGDRGVLAEPSFDVVTPNLVDAHAWWTVPGASADVLAYVKAHLPAGAKPFTSVGGNVAPGFASDSFALAPLAGRLRERVLGVTVVQLTSATTGVRTDGEAVWLTPRPAWERIPASVRSVSFTARGASSEGGLGPFSVARTLAGANARRLVAFINRLGVVQPGLNFCGSDLADSVDLRFLGSTGNTIARAVEYPDGCGFVDLTIGNRRGPALNDFLPTVTVELERLGAIGTCSASDLQASTTPPSGVVRSNDAIWFSFHNQSDSVCRLSGFPELTLLDARGHVLHTTVSDEGKATVRHQGFVAAVPLDPDQSASFSASYRRCGAPQVASTRIALPGIPQPFTLSVGSSRRPFAPCDGRLSLTDLSRI